MQAGRASKHCRHNSIRLSCARKHVLCCQCRRLIDRALSCRHGAVQSRSLLFSLLNHFFDPVQATRLTSDHRLEAEELKLLQNRGATVHHASCLSSSFFSMNCIQIARSQGMHRVRHVIRLSFLLAYPFLRPTGCVGAHCAWPARLRGESAVSEHVPCAWRLLELV